MVSQMGSEGKIPFSVDGEGLMAHVPWSQCTVKKQKLLGLV